MSEVIITSVLEGFDQKNHLFEGLPWFKFNNLGLAVDQKLKFYISVAKGLIVKVRQFFGANSYVCRSYRRKPDSGRRRGGGGAGVFLLLPPTFLIGLTICLMFDPFNLERYL